MQISNLLVTGDMRVDGKIYGISTISTHETIQISSDSATKIVKLGTIKINRESNESPLVNVKISVIPNAATSKSPSVAGLVITENDSNTPKMESMLFDFGHNSNDKDMFVESIMDAQLVNIVGYDEDTADICLVFNELLSSISVMADVMFNDAILFTSESKVYDSSPWETGTSIISAKKRVIGGNIPVFTGATASTDGEEGLVPAPDKGGVQRFLRVDGAWEPIDFTTFDHVEDSDIDALFGDEEITPIYST